MRVFDGLIGNEDIKNTLGAAICEKRFSHAYIIEGPKGSGKHTVARLASAAIMCQDKNMLPCKKCEICQKILNNNCVDVRFFDAFKVDDVRKIKEAIFQSATECDYQIFILNDAQKMTVQAQNALLLSLEEPPKNVVFFILCTDAGVLLETIRSRAQILRTKPLSKREILNYVDSYVETSLPESEIEKIAVLSGGSLGYLLDMLDESKSSALIKSRDGALSFVKGMLNLDTGSANLIYSMFSWQRDRVKELLSLSLVCLRDLAVVKKSKTVSLSFFTSYNEAYQIAAIHPLKKILKLIDSITTGIDNFAVNASVPGVLTSILAEER